MGVTETSPSSCGETVRERTKQVEELILIASNGPRLGGLMHGYTSWDALNTDKCQICVRATAEAGWNIADVG
jgi:hypothetical protein